MVRINFYNEINNDSVQVGDTVYYVKDDETNASITSFTDTDGLKVVGGIVSIGATHIVVDSSIRPPSNAFIMFQKDRVANNTSLLGYYAEVKLINNSTEKAELFALSSEITISSK